MGIKFGEIFDTNANILIQENASENVVFKMTAILSRPNFKDYNLHFQWNQVKWHKVSLMITQMCTVGSVSSCPQAANQYLNQILPISTGHI